MKAFEEKGIANKDDVHARKKESEMATLNSMERKDSEQDKSIIAGPC